LSFINETVNIDYQINTDRVTVFGVTTEAGLNWASVEYDNIIIDGVTANYTGPFASGKKFINVAGDFDATNTVQNCIGNGVTASGALKVDGVQTFTAINNVNGSGQTLTKQ